MKPRSSLKRRLTLAILLAFSLLLGTGGLLIFWGVRDFLYEQFDASLATKARIVMTNAQQQERVIHVYFSDHYLREFDDAIASEFFQVSDMQGESVERSDSLEADDLPIRYGDLEEPAFWNLMLPNGERGRAIGIRFVPRVASIRAGQDPAEAIVVVASSRSRLEATLNNLTITLWLVGGACLGLLLVSVPLLIRTILEPLSRVARQSVHINNLESRQRFATDGLPAELHPIAESLNRFMARLEASYRREHQFSSDIAHELRTPLAELRNAVEVALRWPEESPSHTLENVLEISLEMEALVERLLELARSDRQSRPLKGSRLQMGDLVEDITRACLASAEARSLSIQWTGGPLEVETDATLLRTILRNLIENAVTHATPGTRISGLFEAERTQFTLRLSNETEALREADLPRVFDRLWRHDASRSGSHCGLGLTLARSHAAQLGYEIQARFIGPTRVEFSLRGSTRLKPAEKPI